eukprot:jgi/Chrzof1/2804/UNPLg00719.t1
MHGWLECCCLSVLSSADHPLSSLSSLSSYFGAGCILCHVLCVLCHYYICHPRFLQSSLNLGPT